MVTRMRVGAVCGMALAMSIAACAGNREWAMTPILGTHQAQLWPGEERALRDLRQLTFGGENAEAYWSFDGQQLSFQARKEGGGCDRIYRMDLNGRAPIPVSSGHGATTCAHFFPGGDLLFSSTHLAGPDCPPRPDMSQGYVWALLDSYDIFRASGDGTNLRPLTERAGYDAEATVCGRDGSVVFTSTRDGDLELYRMDGNGGNVRRLTHTPGYDGGAFFNRDCTKIVWRASHPPAGPARDQYNALLARGLVRPSKLEIWIADADGSNPMQLTYLDAASFAPSFHPTEKVILFSSNHGNAPREFDLWAIATDGSGLVRLTSAPGFDGFPHFSPDGRWLAFSSNRATPPGRRDTNVFVARWLGLAATARVETAADRIARDVAWLAAPEREGRGIGTRGLEAAGVFLEDRLRALGLEPAGDEGGFRQKFPVTTGIEAAPSTRIELGGAPVSRDNFSVLGFSASARVSAPMVLADHGVVDPSLGLDDYAGLDVKGKIVLVRRFAPEHASIANPVVRNRLGDIRHKAFLARERGARALLVVDLPSTPAAAPPNWKPPAEASLLPLTPEGPSDVGLPVVMVKRLAVEPHMPALRAGKTVSATVDVSLSRHTRDAFNVVGRLRAGTASRGTVVIGAHYDHLGLGGRHSLAPDSRAPHLGADDNASGTAALLEVTRALSERRATLPYDVLVVLFSAEESGLLGSSHLTRVHEDWLHHTTAMINLDMVGRLRANRVEVLGSDSAQEWTRLLEPVCAAERITCAQSGDGYGPSDQAAFYAAGIPVLHFFTGAHGDYHKPSDSADKINAAGAAAVARLVTRLVGALEETPKLTYRKGTASPVRGDMRSFGASLGTMPDYAGPAGGKPGVLLAGVRPGGAAERAGMQRGDVIIRLGAHEVRTVEDLMYVLNASKPGETVTAVVVRNGQEVRLLATFQESRRTN